MTDARAAEPPRRVGFVSLGCPKALVDSERILTQLRTEGYEISPTYAEADVVVVNTCGFLESAQEESLDAIAEALTENGRVIVTGCLGARGNLIRERFPDVLSVTGPQQYESVVQAVHSALPPPDHNPFTDLVPPQGIRLTPRHYAYLKVAEGCNHKCTFCIIPSMRGKLVSRPIGNVMAEAEALVKSGVKELLVIAQDTSAYGSDSRNQPDTWRGQQLPTRFLELCKALDSLGVWVRLHYVYPYPHVDEVIPLLREGGLLPYLDVPFQHGSPRILKQMRRPAAAENTLRRIEAWRAICPDLTLRSTFIVGFPGESDAEFEELLAFLQTAQLDRVGCFQYSPVPGAVANSLAEPVPDEVKQERWDRFMETQARISAARLQKKIGRELDVLVDAVEGGMAVARSSADAPEIDGNVIIEASDGIHAGDLIRVRMKSADDYDLHAVAVN
ncbi:MAG: ribosomal protein S12 methylthiotransferase [Gammaproteobacteria bacterium RIFCSPLOWO2_02_FULL_61_13]|nr:MAG: ribosomal protein S12 methylthiotransferase [Gammaproteobacteria bacterium RIFCSPLOWO2_02_FULL_61_13]